MERELKSESRHVRSIALDLFFTIITFGLYNLYVQYAQVKALNSILGEPKYSWGWWLFLTIITFGLYHIYHEYRQATDLERKVPGTQHLVLISVALSCFGLSIVCDAIQQTHINRYFGSASL